MLINVASFKPCKTIHKQVILSMSLKKNPLLLFLQILNIANAYEDKRFDPTVSDK